MSEGVRAAVIRAPGQLSVESFPHPDPEPGAVLLRMLYSGICGTDKHTWRGESKQYAGTAHEREAAYPLICGHENVGVIEAIGAGPPPLDEQGRPLAVGDRVVPTANLTCGRCAFCLDQRYPYYLCAATQDYGNSLSCADPPHLFGGWAEVMYLLPGTRLFRVPDELDSQLASMTELLGAGRMIAVDLLAERLHLAGECGADAVLPASDDLRSEVLELTDGVGADVVVDCSGRHETFGEALALARPSGTVIEAGAFVDTGRLQIDPNRDVCIKDITIIGVGGDERRHYPASLRLLARHSRRFSPLITHRVTLQDMREALDTAFTGAAMKVLVAPNGEVA